MTSEITQLILQSPKFAHEQIRDHVRELILSGKMKPGDRMPSTAELARQWNTHVPTVHAALSALVKEGLLVRYPSKGTYVAEEKRALICVGIYYWANVWTQGGSEFQQALHASLKELLDQMRIETDVWIDPRPREQQDKPWEPLLQAARKREFQAVIATAGGLPQMTWLSKLPLPVVFLTANKIPNRVDVDLKQFVDLSLRSLKEQGCRSVGLICPMAANNTSIQGERHGYEEFFERFTDVSRDLGFELRNEWMRLAPHEHAMREMTQERFGYEQFLQLWEQPEKPEGLVVCPDSTARGVVLGLVEKRVRVPEDLRLVLHRNEEIDLLCPVPASYVTSSVRQIARALIQQVQQQYAGRQCKPMVLPFAVAS